ncbi:LOW QUALITY PROTEIN: translocator protein 2 [Dama dama]
MWPQGAIFVVLPLPGPTLVWLLIHHSMPDWCEVRKLPWCPPQLLLVWTTIYSITGYASHLVWKDLGGGSGQPLPLGLAVQLTISDVLILLLAAHPGLALLHLLLLFGLVMRTALLWQPINKPATLLLLPYLAWLTVAVAITHHLWRDSPGGRGGASDSGSPGAPSLHPAQALDTPVVYVNRAVAHQGVPGARGPLFVFLISVVTGGRAQPGWVSGSLSPSMAQKEEAAAAAAATEPASQNGEDLENLEDPEKLKELIELPPFEIVTG